MVQADRRSGAAACAAYPHDLVPFVVKQGLATQVHQAGFSDVTQVDPLQQEGLAAPRVSSAIERQGHTRVQVWAGICGLLVTGMLIASFAVNTGSPTGDTAAQLTAFEQQHLDAILWGAWPVTGAR